MSHLVGVLSLCLIAGEAPLTVFMSSSMNVWVSVESASRAPRGTHAQSKAGAHTGCNEDAPRGSHSNSGARSFGAFDWSKPSVTVFDIPPGAGPPNRDS